MTNILTIDIDYAFSPDIASYDDYVIGSRIDITEQKKILLKKGFGAPRLNKQKFETIVNIYNKFKSKAKVVTVTHHQEILKHIHCDDLNLQNIDHHHDIFYPGWHELENLDEGNWVYHLSQAKNIKEYTWFRNADSENFTADLDLNFKFKQIYDLSVHYVVKPDLIVLCNSPHWTLDEDNVLINKILIGDINANKKL